MLRLNMRKLHKNQTIKCEEIEELLIRQNIENFSEEENSILQNHLKTCKRCQSYQNQLTFIQTSIPISQKSPLKPDPAIRQAVINKINTFKPQKYNIVDSLWQRILNILEYRIPIYQGLIGIACSLLIFVAINYFSLSSQRELERPRYQNMMADTTFYQINVIKNLQIIEQQKIGKNVREDSLLTRFIVSSM